MKLSFKKLFSNDRVVFVFSLLMAVICWFVVALTVDTETNVVIEDVPVNLVSQSSVLTMTWKVSILLYRSKLAGRCPAIQFSSEQR